MIEKEKVPLHKERLDLRDHKDQQELQIKKRKQLRADMQEVFNSPAGRRVLRYLMNLTGWKKGVVGGNPAMGMDVLHGSFYNASRLQVMVELSEHIPVDILRDCEFGVFADFLET